MPKTDRIAHKDRDTDWEKADKRHRETAGQWISSEHTYLLSLSYMPMDHGIHPPTIAIVTS